MDRWPPVTADRYRSKAISRDRTGERLDESAIHLCVDLLGRFKDISKVE
jgi:hypothetical protein